MTLSHYGNMKVKLICLINEYQNSKSEKNSKSGDYGPSTRENIIVKFLAEMHGVKIDFVVTRKFCKRFSSKTCLLGCD